MDDRGGGSRHLLAGFAGRGGCGCGEYFEQKIAKDAKGEVGSSVAPPDVDFPADVVKIPEDEIVSDSLISIARPHPTAQCSRGVVGLAICDNKEPGTPRESGKC